MNDDCFFFLEEGGVLLVAFVSSNLKFFFISPKSRAALISIFTSLNDSLLGQFLHFYAVLFF